ncbi:hypothetical protein G4V62_02025 [Bacillaceae bacterium SIJ1]|uniref:hypothetical protein n=1 Tax=Litoribacterium kuwaitense TaxID=1398745 RepID=UPI001BA5800A|nr:hypothetical protein [Litoribacterium kuwaitense]NGP43784.1 hypothetical protein [Litoribacterium kuwaitense]
MEIDKWGNSAVAERDSKGGTSMKKICTTLTIVLVVFALGACSDPKADAISYAELTEREDAILSTISDQSFVFDFNVDSPYEEVSVWIEKYELGELVNEQVSQVTTDIKESGSIIVASSKNDHEKHKAFHLSVRSNNSFASVEGFDEDAAELENMSSSSWGPHMGEITVDEGEIVLGHIVYSNDANNMSISVANFYEDVKERKKTLEDIDVAYLLKAEFMK